MHIKFLAHGTGADRKAANYLLGEQDATGKPREGVEVLRGNPDMVAAVADSLDFEHRYTSGVIAWAAGRPSHRRADRSCPRRVREEWPGGTGAQPIRLGGRSAPRARRRRSCPCAGRTVRNGTAAALQTDRSLAAAGRSFAAAGRAAERAGDGLDQILRHLRRRARERMEMTRRLVERLRPRGPDRDSGPSR